MATGDVANGGTEAIPYIQIFGERGDTGIIELRKEGSSGFVRGKTDFFNVDAVDVGEVGDLQTERKLCQGHLVVKKTLWHIKSLTRLYSRYSQATSASLMILLGKMKTTILPF